MRVIATWTRLEWRRRWRSLMVLALMVALVTATVLAVVAGARRGQTAFSRLWAQTLPATVTVLPNQPGFDWAKVRALPEVAALTTFAVSDFELEGVPGAQAMFPFADSQVLRTIERPVVLQGRVFSPSRADEVVVSTAFVANFGKGVGDFVTLHLPAPAQSAQGGYDPSSNGPPRGPVIRARIVGVARSFWFSDQPGVPGGVFASPALFARYRVNFMGTAGHAAINALVRLKGGETAIPAFKRDLARVSGRPDIDVWNNYADTGAPARRITGYEAACLLAFGAAALVAAFFLVGQSVARYTSATVPELQVLQAVGLTSRQAVGSASAPPLLAAVAGATLGVAAAILASRWMPIGAASLLEPSPGFDADWLILGPGWVLAPVMVLAGSAAAAATMLAAARRQVLPRRSSVAAAVAGAGLPVAAVVGTRFALEPGRGRSSVPVRPAVAGAIVGVLGIVAAFTFSAGIADAAAHPVRFGQTSQLEGWLGFNGSDFGPAGRVLSAIAADRDVTGLNSARIAVAQSGQVSITTYTYDPVAGKRLPVVLTAGRMPGTGSEILLAPTTARQLHTATGATIQVTGSAGPRTVTVAGIGFVPEGSHNSYDSGAWVSPALYDQLFAGARYPFKFHIAEVALRPGANVQAVAHRLDAAAAAIKGGQAFQFAPPSPPSEIQLIKDVAVLPLLLGAFLALLAVGAVGHALAIAVRRRRHELAVLRALGITRRQARAVVATQASVLAVIGLVFGVPLGLALGRIVWRVVANGTPVAYHPPLAVWALLLTGPLALLAANLLAAWPGQRAARLSSAQILRAE
jgi:FtsX-like permease family protein